MAKWSALMLAAICLLGSAAVGPPLAAGQGAGDEYDLDLPGSGGDGTTPSVDPQSADTSESDDDGFPVLVVVLFVAAGVAVGAAIWRLRKPGSDEPS